MEQKIIMQETLVQDISIVDKMMYTIFFLISPIIGYIIGLVIFFSLPRNEIFRSINYLALSVNSHNFLLPLAFVVVLLLFLWLLWLRKKRVSLFLSILMVCIGFVIPFSQFRIGTGSGFMVIPCMVDTDDNPRNGCQGY